MSKYTTSPVNEAEDRSVMVWEAVSGTTPTVETNVVIRMSNGVTPTASNSTAPTVSTDKVIRMTSGSNPTARESEAVGGTPMVIEKVGGKGSVAQGAGGGPTASISGTPTAFGPAPKDDLVDEGVSTPTAIEGSTGFGPVADVVSGSNTAELRWLIVGTQGTTNVVQDLSTTTTAQQSARIENTGNVGPMAQAVGTNPTVINRNESDVGGTPTVIEGTASEGPVANVVSGSNTAELRWLIVGAEGTANVAENGLTPIVAEERLAA